MRHSDKPVLRGAEAQGHYWRAYTLVEAKSHFKLPTGCSSVPWSGPRHTIHCVLVLKFHGVNRVADDRHPTSDCKCFPYRSCAECDSRSLFSASRNDVIAICVVANFIGQRHVLKLWAQKGPRNARLRSPQKKGETHVCRAEFYNRTSAKSSRAALSCRFLRPLW